MGKLLGRTASGLFWMMRYLERVENTARLTEAGFRMSLTRARTARSEWESVLTTSGVRNGYFETYDKVRGADAIDFVLADRDNPGSLLNSLSSARENARMTRTALTRDVWEAINDSWLELRDALKEGEHHAALPDLITKILQHTAVVRGTINGTMLRNDIFRFVMLGILIERADNTARILDTKYYVLLPSSASVGSSLDQVQWEMILRSASAERSFHWLHGGDISPRDIVDFLVHDKRLPRSIAFCYDEILTTFQCLEQEYGFRPPSHDLAESINDFIKESSSETIIGSGLHEFLRDIIGRNATLSSAIEDDYRFQA